MNIVSEGFENIQVRELLKPVDHEIKSQSGIEQSQHMDLALRRETVRLINTSQNSELLCYCETDLLMEKQT